VEIHTQHGHVAISEASQIGVLSAGGGGGGSLGGGGEIIEPLRYATDATPNGRLVPINIMNIGGNRLISRQRH
jgi:hypothetical protein